MPIGQPIDTQPLVTVYLSYLSILFYYRKPVVSIFRCRFFSQLINRFYQRRRWKYPLFLSFFVNISMRSCCHSLIRNRLLPCLISNKTMGGRLRVQLLSPEIKKIQYFQLKPLSFMATLMSLNCNRLFSQEKGCFVIFNM